MLQLHGFNDSNWLSDSHLVADGDIYFNERALHGRDETDRAFGSDSGLRARARRSHSSDFRDELRLSIGVGELHQMFINKAGVNIPGGKVRML